MSRRARLFLGADAVSARVAAIGRAIAEEGLEDLLLVTPLQGGLQFCADLVRLLPPSVEVDFVSLSSYPTGAHGGGGARVVKDLDTSICGRHVLCVDVAVDTGLSMAFLLRTLRERDPASLRVCALLDRETKRIVELPLAFRGFVCGSEYLIGYGLGLYGLYRNLSCFVVVDDLAAVRADPHVLAKELRDLGIWGREGTNANGA